TKIHVDNESAICVIKNPVYHSKTKHIEIMHHFIRDSYKKRLVKMVKIHTDHNGADLLTKAFDVSRFNFLVASIGKRGQDTMIPQSGGPPIKVGDKAVHKELGDRMERAATTASSLEVEQDSAKPRSSDAKFNILASFGESKGISTMNPSCDKVLDVEEEAWSNKEPSGQNVPFNANGIERGTYEVWLKLTRKQHKAILKTCHDAWNALLNSQLSEFPSLVRTSDNDGRTSPSNLNSPSNAARFWEGIHHVKKEISAFSDANSDYDDEAPVDDGANPDVEALLRDFS
ncbi:hypothetical protein Tco_1425475, partial [Tanacetum coccineum]